MTGCCEPHHQGGNWGQGPSPGLTPKSQSDSRGHLECTLWAPDLVSETPRPSVYREHLVLTAGPGRLRVAWDRSAQQVELAVAPGSCPHCTSLGMPHLLTGLISSLRCGGDAAAPGHRSSSQAIPPSRHPVLAPAALPWDRLQPQEDPGRSWEPLTAQRATPRVGLHRVKSRGDRETPPVHRGHLHKAPPQAPSPA